VKFIGSYAQLLSYFSATVNIFINVEHKEISNEMKQEIQKGQKSKDLFNKDVDVSKHERMHPELGSEVEE